MTDETALPAGKLETVAPSLRRLIAPNPSPFTFTGTCSYLVGDDELAIIDPGPQDESHLAALLAAVGGAKLAYIVVTHTHRDHSQLSKKFKSSFTPTTLSNSSKTKKPSNRPPQQKFLPEFFSVHPP